MIPEQVNTWKEYKYKEGIKIMSEAMMLKLQNRIKELEERVKTLEDKIAKLEETQKINDAKIMRIEDILKEIEKDIYDEDGYDFEIVCPYCNHEFVTEFDDNKTEIKCPECKNIIELDWNEDDDCEADCSCCHGSCEEETDEENEDDDM